MIDERAERKFTARIREYFLNSDRNYVKKRLLTKPYHVSVFKQSYDNKINCLFEFALFFKEHCVNHPNLIREVNAESFYVTYGEILAFNGFNYSYKKNRKKLPGKIKRILQKHWLNNELDSEG